MGDGRLRRLARLRLRAACLSVPPSGGGVDGRGHGGGDGGGAAAELATALGGSRGLQKLDLRQCEVTPPTRPPARPSARPPVRPARPLGTRFDHRFDAPL